jgi:hypothetical protein
MSKAKRIRQANKRRANVHRFTVRLGLATCALGGCRDCREDVTV